MIDYVLLFENVNKSRNIKYVPKLHYLSRPEIAIQLLDIFKQPFQNEFNNEIGIRNDSREYFPVAIATGASGTGKTYFANHRIIEMSNIIKNNPDMYPKAMVDMFLQENRIIDVQLDFNGGGDKITKDSCLNILGPRLFTNGILGVK